MQDFFAGGDGHGLGNMQLTSEIHAHRYQTPADAPAAVGIVDRNALHLGQFLRIDFQRGEADDAPLGFGHEAVTQERE